MKDSFIHPSGPWPSKGHPDGVKMEPPPRLFSHQWIMALLAGPPRRDENKEEVVALVRRRLCLVPQREPVHHQCDAGAFRGHPKSVALEHEY